jgi:RNase P subunit RPR2
LTITTIGTRILSAGEVAAMLANSTRIKNAEETASEQSWMGFVCRDCGAPLAIHRAHNGSRAGDRSTRGWRITCISCGVPDFYELGTAMVKIVAT